MKRIERIGILAVLLLALLPLSCGRQFDVRPFGPNTGRTTHIYPDYQDVTIPCNVAPLNFYYTDPADLPAIQRIYDRVAGELKAPLVVEVKPLKNIYRAEEEHQDYLDKNPQGYCHISPALMEFARNANDAAGDTD